MCEDLLADILFTAAECGGEGVRGEGVLAQRFGDLEQPPQVSTRLALAEHGAHRIIQLALVKPLPLALPAHHRFGRLVIKPAHQ